MKVIYLAQNMLDEEFISKILEAFGKINGEIDEKGGEFDFRYALVDYLFRDVLGWSRKTGEGHFKIERERKDILFYDDSDPPMPVFIVETVNPNEESASHIGKLEGYLREIGRVRYGILTNGHDFSVYEYERDKKGERIKKILPLDIDEIIRKGVANLTVEEKRDISQLKRLLVRDRYVKLSDIVYFKVYRNDIPLNYKKRGYGLFIEGLRKSLEELNEVFTCFFDTYMKRTHISGERLREAFENWKKTRVGVESEPKETFCKETAYILLNRLLFTRICEDKGYIPRKISREALAIFYEGHKSLPTPYLEALEDAFRIAEREYERIYQVKIFDWWRIEKAERYALSKAEENEQRDLEKELNYTIRNVLKRLNHFDFKTVNSDILGHVYEDYLSKEERKKLGEYYTPPEVVRYILDAVGYIPEEDIEGKRLLDPACGSGTFLVEAMKRLIRKFLLKFHRRETFRLNPEEASMILESIRESIYGLDINVFACHITEMNLFFQTIDLYENIKRKYPLETFKGFNIFCTDSLLPTERKLEDFTDVRVKPFLNDQKKIANIKGMKFDFVVGNPPYVRVQKLVEEQKEAIKKYHESAIGKFDLFVPFIEQGIKWLNDSGKLGYITSNSFIKRDYGKKLRDFILKNCSIQQIIDFGDSGVFRDVTNYPCIVILERGKRSGHIIKCVNVFSSKPNLIIEIKNRIIRRTYHDECYVIFEIGQNLLNEGETWKLIPKNILEVFNKISNNSTHLLKDIRERVFLGFIAGAREIYFISEKDVERIGLENELLKPVPKGGDVKRWRILWNDRWVIYPQNDDGIPLPVAELSKSYPKIYNYLGEHESTLKERRYYGKTPEELYGVWFTLIHPKSKSFFEQPKIITPNLSIKNNFAFDKEGYYLDDDCYGIILKDKSEQHYLYILGLLNSAVLEFYIKQISPYASGKYYRYKTGYLEKLPIKLPKTRKEEKHAEEIVKKVNYILEQHKELSKREKRISEFPESYVKRSLPPLSYLMESQELSKESYSPSRLRIEVFKDVEGRMIYKVALTKKDYIAFKTKGSAKFLFEVLKRKNRIIKNDLLRMEVPSDADAEEIVKEYEADLSKIGDLKREIEVLDENIDELVYELYGLDEENRKVIESYLNIQAK